jgi:6-phosphogluconolactonase (cycloisomerase 2 family)
MTSRAKWTRRTFLANASLASAAMLSSQTREASAKNICKPIAKSFLACVASRSTSDAISHQLEAFVVRGGEPRLLATLASPEPFGAVAVHPSRNVIYAAYDTEEYLGLPKASIAAFAIDESSRSFVLLRRQALTLSATRPRHISISPDSTTLLVSASGGGSYNALQIATDGSILNQPHALKLTGCGPHPSQHSASPGFSAFLRSGQRAYACDFGSDRIDQLTFTDGVPSIESRAFLLPGSGPCHLAIHPSQQAIAVISHLRPAVTAVEINPVSGRLGSTSRHLVLDAATLSHAYFRASGRELCVTGRTKSGAPAVFTLRMDRPSFTLRQTGMTTLSADDHSDLLRAKDALALWGRTGTTIAIREL